MITANEIARHVHRKRAAAVLGKRAEYQWLVDRAEILDELGRIDTDYALLVAAKRLCELKPPTTEAIEIIRRHKEFNRLADEIIHAVNDYTRRHPGTSRVDILRALEAAGSLLAGVDGENKPGIHQYLFKAGKTVATVPVVAPRVQT
ncbi:MAG: hypothetical protein HOP29_03680 [Phycisphaerales bacterium]|nr:hypothetical protein [Phycisphaerales bacterium]